MASIHELEERMRVDHLPPVDLDVRAVSIERVLGRYLDRSSYERAAYTPLHSWSADRFEARVEEGSALTVAMKALGTIPLAKSLELSEEGAVQVTYRWDPVNLPADAWFAPEISIARDPGVTFDPVPEHVWRYDIVTVSKREDGLEQTVQGHSITPLWPCELGAARVVFPAGSQKAG
jgi:hypothetical protein